jgi:membrane protease YdiL (CAAX protease family)
MLQHFLAFLLIVGFPIWDRVETRRLKTSTDPRVKIQSYQLTIALLWTTAALAVAALGWPAVTTIRRGPGEAAWLPPMSRGFIGGAAIALIATGVVPFLRSARANALRDRMTKAFRKLNFFLPVTPTERRWFAVVCVTAGICEEMLYRGFFIHYLRDLPVPWGLTGAVVISSAAFGLAHLYQGFFGVIQTAVMGAVLGIIFASTGNIAIPVILHAAIDLRLLLLLRPGVDLGSYASYGSA